MPYKVEVYVAQTYAAVTVKDWLNDSPCVDTETGKEIKDVPVNPSATFHISVGRKNGVGGVVVYETVPGATPEPSHYEIPADLDATGKITFPKQKALSRSDLGELAQEVQELKRNIAGRAPPR